DEQWGKGARVRIVAALAVAFPDRRVDGLLIHSRVAAVAGLFHRPRPHQGRVLRRVRIVAGSAPAGLDRRMQLSFPRRFAVALLAERRLRREQTPGGALRALAFPRRSVLDELVAGLAPVVAGGGMDFLVRRQGGVAARAFRAIRRRWSLRQ